MLTAADQAPGGTAALFDAPALAADLDRLGERHGGNGRELRSAIVQRLKATLAEGRAKAEQMLLADRHGRRCAERLCFMHDEIIRVLHEFAERRLYPAQSRSEEERMAVVATGGYGRG